MNRNVLYLVILTSIVMALAVLEITRYSTPMIVAIPLLIVVFAICAYILLLRKPKSDSSKPSGNAKNRLPLLFIPLALGAIGGLVSALQEGWNIGDTIGACVFLVLSSMIIYESNRRNRNARSR
jgi:uncharacterized membrane protein YfcA